MTEEEQRMHDELLAFGGSQAWLDAVHNEMERRLRASENACARLQVTLALVHSIAERAGEITTDEQALATIAALTAKRLEQGTKS